MDWIARRPIPGQANTVSVTTAPPSSGPNWRPLMVRIGSAAFRRVCFVTTQSSDTPLARAKGVSELWVVTKHTLRNAALPILTINGLQFGPLLGGAVVTETVFAWPGIGRLAIQSIYNRDYPVVQSTVFIAAVLFIVINLALDVVYG